MQNQKIVYLDLKYNLKFERSTTVENNKIFVISNDKEFSEEINESLIFNGYNAESYFYENIYNFKQIYSVPDLIILDLFTFDFYNIDIIEFIKNSSVLSNVPIIAISGYFNELEDRNNFIDKYGFRECLIKPINPAYMIEEIKKVLCENKLLENRRKN
jgi:response regulator RpfG family c-di-GMP phosphodiesterase